MIFPAPTGFSLTEVLLRIRDLFFQFWSWITRNVRLVRVGFFFTFTAASIRAAVSMVGMLYTKVSQIQTLANSTGSSLASSGLPQGSILDKLNAVLPVGETIAFMGAYFAVLVLTTAYMLIRSFYNALPGKLT